MGVSGLHGSGVLTTATFTGYHSFGAALVHIFEGGLAGVVAGHRSADSLGVFATATFAIDGSFGATLVGSIRNAGAG